MNNKVVTNSNTKYHNVFGIAAYDNDPLREGIKYAKQAGWDTVSKQSLVVLNSSATHM